MLASPEGFWIAERFLSLPAEVRPAAPPDDGDLPDDYLASSGASGATVLCWCQPSARSWTSRQDFANQMYREAARSDLPFWLNHMRELLANPELPGHVQPTGAIRDSL